MSCQTNPQVAEFVSWLLCQEGFDLNKAKLTYQAKTQKAKNPFKI